MLYSSDLRTTIVKFKSIRQLLLFRLLLIDRYIITQLITFFLFSVGLLSAVGVAIGTVADLAYKTAEYNLPIFVAVLIFCAKIPEYIAYALPISILLTTLVIYGRLSSDRELIAMGSVGISLYRLVTPALIFSLIITGITFTLNELVVPAANYQANLLQNPFIPETELNLQKQDIFYPEYQANSTIKNQTKQLKNIYYAKFFDGHKLHNIIIMSWSRGSLTQIITAQSAQWNETLKIWDLFTGKIDTLAKNVSNFSTQRFKHQQLPLSANVFQIVAKERSPEDMNIAQIKEYLDIIRDSGREREVAKLRVRIQQKRAFPFICLVFALVGSALGADATHINKSKAFGLCVAIVFIYYLLGFIIGSLGIAGILSPLIAAWMPNFLCLGIGIRLLRSANS